MLDIHVPELTSHESLRAAIVDIRPSFISFVLAFIVATMQWVGHLRRQGVFRTSPEAYAGRAEAEQALWKMADDCRADCHHDRQAGVLAPVG